MVERTETGFEVFPETKDLQLTATKAAEKGKTAKGKYYYIFRFKCVYEGRPKGYNEAMMTWMAGDLLRALRCKEVSKNVFEWEKDEIINRKVIVDIVHEADFKDPDKMVARMKNIRPADPHGLEEPADPNAPPVEEGVPDTAAAEGDDIPF